MLLKRRRFNYYPFFFSGETIESASSMVLRGCWILCFFLFHASRWNSRKSYSTGSCLYTNAENGKNIFIETHLIKNEINAPAASQNR
jgi:hypothetical protein